MFCKYCGKKIRDDSKFCKYCGRKLINEIAETSELNPHSIKQSAEVEVSLETKEDASMQETSTAEMHKADCADTEIGEPETDSSKEWSQSEQPETSQTPPNESSDAVMGESTGKTSEQPQSANRTHGVRILFSKRVLVIAGVVVVAVVLGVTFLVPSEADKLALQRAEEWCESANLSKEQLHQWLVDENYSEKAAKYATSHVDVNWKKNALKTAQGYVDSTDLPPSEEGLYDRLCGEDGDGFTKNEAQYAVKNVKADYKKNALRVAEYFSEENHYSKNAIYDDLIDQSYEKFTKEQAQYAIDNLKADYKKNALKSAESFSDDLHLSKSGIYDFLIGEDYQFTKDEAKYAIKNLKADYKKNALKKAQDEIDDSSYPPSKEGLYKDLCGEDGEGFTKDEAQYALDHVDVDYKANALKRAKTYRDSDNLSNEDIKENLELNDFTKEEIKYAMDNLK